MLYVALGFIAGLVIGGFIEYLRFSRKNTPDMDLSEPNAPTPQVKTFFQRGTPKHPKGKAHIIDMSEPQEFI